MQRINPLHLEDNKNNIKGNLMLDQVIAILRVLHKILDISLDIITAVVAAVRHIFAQRELAAQAL